MSTTTLTDGSPVTADHREINPTTGQQKGYVVLSDEERAKGYVRHAQARTPPMNSNEKRVRLE